MDGEISEEDLKNMTPEQIAELQKKNCIFCRIISKEIPAKIVYEDDKVFCILDINPATSGHMLIMPKEHYQIMPQLPDDLTSHIFVVAKAASNALLKAFSSQGTNIFVANGFIAGQRAPHFMMHVFSRDNNDKVLDIPKYTINDEQAEKLKKLLQAKMEGIFGTSASKPLEVPVVIEGKKEEVREEAEEIKEDKKPTEFEEKIEEELKKPEKPIKKKKEEKAKGKSGVNIDDIARLFLRK